MDSVNAVLTGHLVEDSIGSNQYEVVCLGVNFDLSHFWFHKQKPLLEFCPKLVMLDFH